MKEENPKNTKPVSMLLRTSSIASKMEPYREEILTEEDFFTKMHDYIRQNSIWKENCIGRVFVLNSVLYPKDRFLTVINKELLTYVVMNIR